MPVLLFAIGTKFLHLKFGLFEKHTKFEKKIFLMVLTNQLIYLINVKTMREIFSNYVCFSKSPNFTREIECIKTQSSCCVQMAQCQVSWQAGEWKRKTSGSDKYLSYQISLQLPEECNFQLRGGFNHIKFLGKSYN